MNAPRKRHQLLNRLDLKLPIIQAPMAGVSTPAMAAAVSNAGGLGSIAVGSENPVAVGKMIAATRELTKRAFNVNVFCHHTPQIDNAKEFAWIERLRPEFARFDSTPPSSLNEIYKSFVADDAMLNSFIQSRPEVVSFHFGLPTANQIIAMRKIGIVLIASVTNLDEAMAAADAGMDAIIAQGYEAGGHRGMFNPAAHDDCLGTSALTELLVHALNIPVIAAGGIMNGADIAAVLCLGAIAAQLGTAFIASVESSADTGYRTALQSNAKHTVMTSVISGRPARCLTNLFTAFGSSIPLNEIPAYPMAYDAGKALNIAAKTKSEFGYGAHWAGKGAPSARSLPASDITRQLAEELQAALA